MEKSADRLSNMDLLRVICSVFVIIEHFCESGGCNAFGFAMETPSAISYPFLRLLYSLSRVAVPCFIILSGYFSINSTKQRIGKVISLTLTVISYSMITYVAGILLGSNTFSLKQIVFTLLPQNYYLYLFLTLYLLSPFINRLIAGLSQKQYQRLLGVLIFAFVVWSTFINALCGIFGMQLTGVFATGRTTTDTGFNICNFVTLYLIGGYIKKYPVKLKTKGLLLVSAGILGCAVITAVSAIIFKNHSIDLLSYDSIFIVLQSVFLVVIFSDVSIRHSKMLNFAANNTFGIYLIHWYFLSFFATRVFNIQKVIASGFAGCAFISFVTIICAYICSLLFSTLFNLAVTPLSRWFKNTKIAGVKIFGDE